MSVLQRIRRKVRAGDYVLRAHCLTESLPDEGFDREDALHALATGYLERRLTDDPVGIRYCVVGAALDGRLLELVCRFDPHGKLVIITAYEVE